MTVKTSVATIKKRKINKARKGREALEKGKLPHRVLCRAIAMQMSPRIRHSTFNVIHVEIAH